MAAKAAVYRDTAVFCILVRQLCTGFSCFVTADFFIQANKI